MLSWVQDSVGFFFVAPSHEEFQILQGQDWTARYYPTARGEGVEGPGNVHGRNFRVTALPANCMQLEILWDLLGRQVKWKFLNAAEQEIQTEPAEKKAAAKKGAKARSAPRRASNRGPFFLVGSWDNWKGRKHSGSIPAYPTEIALSHSWFPLRP